MVDLAGVAFGLGTFALFSIPGWLIIGLGYLWYRTQAQVQDLETTDIVSVTPGLVQVQGEAKPIDGVGTVTAPLTGTESLAYEFRIMGSKSSKDNWTIFRRDREHRRLRVEDRTGTAFVDPDGFSLYLEGDETVITGREDAPPEVLEFLDEYSTEMTFYRKIRFVERRLEPGQEALVIGKATREAPSTPVAGSTTYISKADISTPEKWLGHPLALSNQGESGVVETQTMLAAIGIGCGCIWILISMVVPLMMIVDSLFAG